MSLDEKEIASIKKRVRSLYEDGENIDIIETSILEQHFQYDIPTYLASSVRRVVLEEIERLRKGPIMMRAASGS